MSGGEGARRVGRWGEALAAEYLRRQGYKLLSSGYCCRMGEIDLIGVREGILAFVEVKTRQNERFGQGREFVGQRKQVRILAAAQQYLLEHPSCNGLQPRFDVAEVMAPKGTATADPAIYYLENAFDVGGWSDGYSTF